jgi:phage baseplate assembly protein V
MFGDDEREYGTDSTDTRFSNILCSGIVVNRRETPYPSVQVSYPDRGTNGFITDWLPVRSTSCTGAQIYFLPRKGEVVTVYHPSGALETGVVLGGNFTSNLPGPTPGSIDSLHIVMDDGTTFDLDPIASAFNFTSPGLANISFKGNVGLTTQANLNVSVQGNLDATVTGTATIQAPNVNVQGNLNVSGNLTVSGTSNLNGGGTANPQMSNADGSGGGS